MIEIPQQLSDSVIGCSGDRFHKRDGPCAMSVCRSWSNPNQFKRALNPGSQVPGVLGELGPHPITKACIANLILLCQAAG